MDKSTPFTHPPEGYGAQKRIRDLINHAAKQKAEIERLQLELKYKLDQSERIKNLEAEIERLQKNEELWIARDVKHLTELGLMRAVVDAVRWEAKDLKRSYVWRSNEWKIGNAILKMVGEDDE